MKTTLIRAGAFGLSSAMLFGGGVAMAQNPSGTQPAGQPAQIMRRRGAGSGAQAGPQQMPQQHERGMGNGRTSTSGATGAHNDVTDTWITTKVKSEFLAAKHVKSADIHVKTEKGVVTLTGTQPSRRDVDQAKTIAMHVKGVKHVDATGLKVKS
ncbi:MAG TPA: BON domain-containing protein [Nevskiaceae bacterium]